MVMIRVKIRYGSRGAEGKVLRFDNETTGFDELLRKVVAKLKNATNPTAVSPLSELDQRDRSFQIRLGGDCLVEDASEIDHGDDLVLMPVDRLSENGKSTIERQKRNAVKEEGSDRKSKESKRAVVETEAASVDLGNRYDSVKKEGDLDIDDEVICLPSTSRNSSGYNKEKKVEIISLSSDEEEDEDEDDGSIEEGSDAWEEEDESSLDHEDRNDPDFEIAEDKFFIGARSKRKQWSKPRVESPLEVIMKEKDVPSAPGYEQKAENDEEPSDRLQEASVIVNEAGKKTKDLQVKHRIIKLLNTGFHDQSNEYEAKNAMKLAQRLMRKHNLSQALLLRERETSNLQNQSNDDEILKGGLVEVRIVNRKTRKPSLFSRWISDLTGPVCLNFGVQCYHQVRRGVKCFVTFYGIFTNVQLAAYAFKVATERIAQMVAEYQAKKRGGRISTKSLRLSYALGVVSGISKEVENSIKVEKKKHEQKLKRARSAVSTGKVYEESDNDEGMDYGDDRAGFSFACSPTKNNDEYSDEVYSLQACSKNKNSSNMEEKANDEEPVDSKTISISGLELQHRVKQLEKEDEAALVLFNHNKKIAEKVLKERNIKVYSGRKWKAINFDRLSYNKGLEDSKEIDINQRAIRDEIKVKREKTDRKLI